MAEQIVVEFVDDIDGSPAQQTVTFALDGVMYEIDLNDRHALHLRSVLEHHIKHARTAPAPSEKWQAAREEQHVRQSNKELTEQIRGAVLRTREHLSKKAAAEQVMPGDEEQAPAGEATWAEPITGDGPKKPVSAPELLPPQFLSA